MNGKELVIISIAPVVITAPFWVAVVIHGYSWMVPYRRAEKYMSEEIKSLSEEINNIMISIASVRGYKFSHRIYRLVMGYNRSLRDMLAYQSGLRYQSQSYKEKMVVEIEGTLRSMKGVLQEYHRRMLTDSFDIKSLHLEIRAVKEALTGGTSDGKRIV
jgi:hypothetical protein